MSRCSLVTQMGESRREGSVYGCGWVTSRYSKLAQLCEVTTPPPAKQEVSERLAGPVGRAAGNLTCILENTGPQASPSSFEGDNPQEWLFWKGPTPRRTACYLYRVPLPWRSIRCSWNSIFWLRAKLSPQLKQRAPTGQWRACKCPQLSHQVPWSCQLPLSLPGELTGRLAVGGVSAEWGWHGLVIPPLSNQRRGRPFCVPTGTDLKRTLNQASDPQANCFPRTTTFRSAYNL